MNNKQRLNYILQLERHDKIKKIVIGVTIVLVMGGLLIYSQYKNFVNIQ